MGLMEQKKLSESTGHDEISFDVTGSMVTDENEDGNRHEQRNKCKQIQAWFAAEFGLERNLVEVMRPTPVEHGFKVKIFVFVGDDRSIGEQFACIMGDTANLAEIMRKCWDL